MESYIEAAWIVGLPLIGWLIQALFGQKVIDTVGKDLGRKIMGGLAVVAVAVPFALACYLAYSLSTMPPNARESVVTLFDWITIAGLHVPFELRVDTLSITMTLVITGVGSLIHIYATSYMAEDRDYTRFFTYFNLFIAAMLILVLGNNLLMLFIGWEGVGVCSYLLIGFWYKDVANAKAANKAFIVNRVGDYGMTLGIFLLAMMVIQRRDLFASVDPRWLSYDVFLPFISRIFAEGGWLSFWCALCFFVGAMGKSAQWPLYQWLPDAMAGPTPVSALIHAATMVTSGVYLLNRMHDVFLASPLAMSIVALVGAFTALLGALIAFGQTDLKKVLAYSTVSQLGFMFIACGVGAFWAGIFHVVTHAFFKALLFLGSGAVIHAMAHDQDMRNYGNLRKYLPITYLTMGIGWAAIAGVPWAFAGFWSKEAILGAAVNSHGGLMVGPLSAGALAGWVGFLVATLTAFYMTRMMALTFGTKEERWKQLAPEAHGHGHHDHHAHEDHHGHEHHDDPHGFFLSGEEAAKGSAHDEHHHALDANHKPHEVPALMWIPLAVLAVFSLGWTGAMMYGGKPHAFEQWLYPDAEYHAHAIGYSILIPLSIAIVVVGTGLGLLLYAKKLPVGEGWDESKWAGWRKAARNQFGWDWLSTTFMIKAGGVLGNVFWAFDKYVIDGLLHAVAGIAGGLGGLFRKAQTGFVRAYALGMLLGAVAFLAYLLYMVNNL